MKKILVPTDFSDHAHNALFYALQVAKATGAGIDLLHTNSSNNIESRSFKNFQTFLLHDWNQANDYFKNYVNKIRRETIDASLSDIAVRLHLKRGSAVDEVFELIEKDGFHLLVLGTKGATSIKEMIWGSTTESIISKVKCPVLAVPRKARLSKLASFVYATDLALKDRLGISTLYNFCRQVDGHFNFLHIIEEETRSLATKIEKFDLFAAELLGETDYAIVQQRAESVIEGLNNYTSANAINVLAMRRKGESGLDSLFSISFTKKMAFHGNTAVLIFTE